MRLLSVLIMVFTTICVMTGCVTTQQQAKPMTADESAIHQTFERMQVAWKNIDKAEFMTFISEDASMMTGRERKIVSKSGLAATYPAKMKQLGPIKFKVRKIMIEGNEAKVKLNVIINNEFYPQKWTMVKTEGLWLAKQNRY